MVPPATALNCDYIRIQAAEDASVKKKDDDAVTLSRTKSGVARVLGLPTWLLVLGEIDTIARRVFPCVWVCNMLLKELRLVQEPRASWNGVIIAYTIFAVGLCLGVLTLSVTKIVADIGLQRVSKPAQGDDGPASERENPAFREGEANMSDT